MECGLGFAPENLINDESVLKLSPSAIMEFLKSPAHYHARYINKIKKITKPMAQSNLVHMAILEPEKFDNLYSKEPNINDFPEAIWSLDGWKDVCRNLDLKISGNKSEIKQRIFEVDPSYKTRDWDWIVVNQTKGKSIVSETDWNHIAGLKASLEYHPVLKVAMSREGHREQNAWIYDGELNILFRFKMDFLDNTGLIYDIKKCPSAGEKKFSQKIYHDNLYVQAAMYFDFVNVLAQAKIFPAARAFIFAAYEMEVPYIWSAYKVDSGTLDAGEKVYKKAISRLLECRESNTWHGYSNKISDIALPHYAWNDLDHIAEQELSNE
jgi:exodeoxyribonuclease VIII